MGWTKWKLWKPRRVCRECGYTNCIYIRYYKFIGGMIIRTQMECESCKQIEKGTKKKKSRAELKRTLYNVRRQLSEKRKHNKK